MFGLFRSASRRASPAPLRLYNTLTRRKDEFRPIRPGTVGMYTCGPTVYNYPHLGNMRTYLFEDILRRVLEYDGYKVRHVMNITDVGHLTNDRDMGEDKVEAAIKKARFFKCKRCGEIFPSDLMIPLGNQQFYINFNPTIGNSHTKCQKCPSFDTVELSDADKPSKLNFAKIITEFYTRAFFEDEERLNIERPTVVCKATDHIPEQIALIRTLEQKGFAYRTSDGVYFDTAKFPRYAELSGQKLDALKEGARVEANSEKRNHTDFALWKFSPAGAKRQMEWQSPWGVGFPGWHIECSAMSMKYLGTHFDIHCGGVDHINVHHTNEIAQSEAATGIHPWVNVWVHGEFLNVKDGEKMAKSSGNFLTVASETEARGIDPLAYRFASLSVHYRKPMEWNEEILAASKNGLENLYAKIANLGTKRGKISTEWKEKFSAAINDDLNMPQAMAVLNEMLKSGHSPADKLATALDFDRVLGLRFDAVKKEEKKEVPAEVQKLLDARAAARANKDWKQSDDLRDAIRKLGYEVKDTANGQEVTIA